MTREDYEKFLKIYKENELSLKVLKPVEIFMGSSTLIFDAKIIKDVYSLGYIEHIDYLSLPSSKIYLMMVLLGLTGYVCSRLLNEYILEENEQIEKEIKDYQYVKKPIY